jgi:E3 ubiquitin-protein ligase BOI-like protein
VFGPNGEQPPLSPLPPLSTAQLPPLSTAAALEAATAGSAAWAPDDGEAPATQCAVCWSAHVRVLLLPCAHLCICAACDAGLARRVCPLCREPISATINARFP